MMMMFSSFIISTAARCSEVCGCGQLSFAAISSSAASITATPPSIVAMRMSCPGQSTNEMCRISVIGFLQYTQRVLSSFSLPKDWKHSGGLHEGHLNILAFAYPSLMVMFLIFSLCKRTVYSVMLLATCTPEIAFTIVDFPCATCPIVPTIEGETTNVDGGLAANDFGRERGDLGGVQGLKTLLGKERLALHYALLLLSQYLQSRFNFFHLWWLSIIMKIKGLLDG
eukprot:TRINITY_DN8549_c0_g1_i6.p1 TRINITY_DN8549_c0_g1~~TRINITY_DN8549_c0_g1_i6.p1  ORF type:complete len:226 (+),score=18.41 TRINITY_DN8549_c0_g1_i6:106-783(+)